jgi:stage III sporulation protein SpoIIIAA
VFFFTPAPPTPRPPPPKVVIVDEIGTEAEALACRTIAER